MQIDASLLNLQGVDAGLMDKWRTRADGFETEYETVFWDGLVPEDQLDAYLRHKMAMNQAPREDLEVEDDEPDRRRYRQMEKHYAALGRESFQLALWHRESEQFVGSSHLYWDPHTPTGLNQGDTVVLESFRGRGLGCWLKAEMFRQIQIRKPEVQWILTGNAGSNAPMLSINRQMGFRPYDTMQVWQMDIGGI
jgi:GNAT superfamily N-acetyltransferase